MQGNTLLHLVTSEYKTLNRPIRQYHQADPLTWQNRYLVRETENGIASPAQLLIQAGADLRAKNDLGETPLIRAMKMGETNKDNIRTLICMSTEEEINEIDNSGRTAFHHLKTMRTLNRAFSVEIEKVKTNNICSEM